MLGPWNHTVVRGPINEISSKNNAIQRQQLPYISKNLACGSSTSNFLIRCTCCNLNSSNARVLQVYDNYMDTNGALSRWNTSENLLTNRRLKSTNPSHGLRPNKSNPSHRILVSFYFAIQSIFHVLFPKASSSD